MPAEKKPRKSKATAAEAASQVDAARAERATQKIITFDEAKTGLTHSLKAEFDDPAERALTISFFAVKVARLSGRPYSEIALEYQIHAGDPPRRG